MSIRVGMIIFVRTTARPREIGAVGTVISGARRRIVGMPGNRVRYLLGRRITNSARRYSVPLKVKCARGSRVLDKGKSGPATAGLVRIVIVRCRRVLAKGKTGLATADLAKIEYVRRHRVPDKDRSGPATADLAKIVHVRRRRVLDKG